LVCTGITSGALQSIDLSGTPEITDIDLSNNCLGSLDVSYCPRLKSLICRKNRLAELDLSGNEPLEYLDCSLNEIRRLNLEGNLSLRSLRCSHNAIEELISPRSTALEELICHYNGIKSLNISLNRGLKRIECAGNSLLELNLASNTALEYLDCTSNKLEALPLRRNEMLETLLCSGNSINVLDLRFNPRLKVLNCSSNELKTLDLSGNPLLESFKGNDNHFSTLDVSMLSHLSVLECRCPEMITLLMDRGQNVEVSVGDTTSIRYLDDIARITDPFFLEYLLGFFDSNGDGILTMQEAETITSVNIDTDKVETLDGIECLTGLKFLKCEGSVDDLGRPTGRLTSLDLSHNDNIEQVLCGHNSISKLDLSGATELRTLWCFDNRLTNLDVSECKALTDLNCERNLIGVLELTSNDRLVSLDCSPMAGEEGANVLKEVHLANVRIDYINGNKRRNICCIPPRTDLYVNNVLLNALQVPFMFNYNAKDFSFEDKTFKNTPGAQWDHNMKLNGTGFTYKGNYIRIVERNYSSYAFSSPSRNPFNRSGSDDLTIIAKVKGESSSSFSIFSCRSDNYGYCYMFREGDASTRYFYLHDNRAYGSATNILVNTLPNIVAARASNGKVWMESFTDNIKGNAQPLSWGDQTDVISLFYGGTGSEYWRGDFYWIFLSLNALSNEEIQQVIDYNEN